MIYSQIDMITSKDRDEVLASFGGDTEKAIKSLEMSIRTLEKMDDKNELSKAHNNLGNLLDDMGRKEDAEAEYREALRINSNDTETHYNLGILLDEMGRREDAEAEYREVLRINPDYADAHGNLGILYSETGNNEEAKKELEIAKRLFDEQGREADVKKAEKWLNTLK